jgi:hypothetical protein
MCILSRHRKKESSPISYVYSLGRRLPAGGLGNGPFPNTNKPTEIRNKANTIGFVLSIVIINHAVVSIGLAYGCGESGCCVVPKATDQTDAASTPFYFYGENMDKPKYEHKPGNGSAFKNSFKKDGDSKPDWKGEMKLEDGTLVKFAMWEGETKNGAPKFSIKVDQNKDGGLPNDGIPF